MCITHISSYNAQTDLLYAATSSTYNTVLESNTQHLSRCFISLIQNIDTIAESVDLTGHNNIYEVMILTLFSLLS